MVKVQQFLFLIASVLLFRNEAEAQTQLDQYISEGLANNSVLQQKQADISKAMIDLQTAKSYFLPSVNFNGTFSTAQGGRYAELPVGDLLNPVYATLNQMTGTNNFPQIENAQIDFLPKNYYDAYVRTAMPLVNTDLIYNKRIQEQRMQLTQLDADVYARQLVNDIKVAYYNYVSAGKAIRIYTEALSVMNKNVELNEALLANGKGLKASVLRAQSEQESLRAQLKQAQSQQLNAQYYFNFLLNRELESSIIEETTAVTLSETPATGVSNREELEMLQQAKEIQETVVRMNEHFWVPKLNAFLDLGSQGVDWEMSNKSAYYMVGVSLSIPIFNGNRNVQKVKLSEWNLKQSELAIEQTTLQLSLAVRMAVNELSTAMANYESAVLQETAAKEYFALMENAYAQGMITQIEFLDASNQLVQAQLQVAIRQQEINSAVARLERETATYPINENLKTN